jgi:hypothetical protein
VGDYLGVVQAVNAGVTVGEMKAEGSARRNDPGERFVFMTGSVHYSDRLRRGPKLSSRTAFLRTC